MSIEQNSSENVNEVFGHSGSLPTGEGGGRGLHTVYFSLGSNLGNKRENLNKAIKLMDLQGKKAFLWRHQLWMTAIARKGGDNYD